VATNDSLGSLSRKWRSTRSETEATLPSRIDKKISFGTLKLKSILADKTAGCSQFSKRLFRENLSCVRLSFVAHSDQQRAQSDRAPRKTLTQTSLVVFTNFGLCNPCQPLRKADDAERRATIRQGTGPEFNAPSSKEKYVPPTDLTMPKGVGALERFGLDGSFAPPGVPESK
jgi:hypothetical protein